MTRKDVIRNIVLHSLKFNNNKGLFSWKSAFPYLANNPKAKEKLLITDYKEENKTIWAYPTAKLKNEINELLNSEKLKYRSKQHVIRFFEEEF